MGVLYGVGWGEGVLGWVGGVGLGFCCGWGGVDIGKRGVGGDAGGGGGVVCLRDGGGAPQSIRSRVRIGNSQCGVTSSRI